MFESLRRKTVLLGLGLAMLALTLIGVGGMLLSVWYAEGVRGSASAINVAGSLRMQSHRMGSLVLARLEFGGLRELTLDEAITRFETSLGHASLKMTLDRFPDSRYAAIYRSVQATWLTQLKPRLVQETTFPPGSRVEDRHRDLLIRIDLFVNDIDQMVAELERETELKIQHLRSVLGLALLLTITVMGFVMVWLRRALLNPLGELVTQAGHIARGDFSARVAHVADDELGQVGRSFNVMAEDLNKLYQGLEMLVQEKTLELTRSNRSLSLLYRSIAQLYEDPGAEATYRAILVDIESLLGAQGSMTCLFHGEGAEVLASTLSAARAPCRDGDCAGCLAASAVAPGGPRQEGGFLYLPLRDSEQLYGVLRLTLPENGDIEPWQAELLEALSKHIGIALGITHRLEQERRVLLLEERSVIARELHDSIAQALSYMKIQTSLMQPLLNDPSRNAESEVILRDLREGINAAYRQLRELLATFRLGMDGNFLDLLVKTLEEFSQRGNLVIHRTIDLGHCHLAPQQEIHLLQIVREALSNVLRHAHATQVWVSVRGDDTHAVEARIEDDGVGLPESFAGRDHYGLSIMRERAQGLHGEIQFGGRASPEGPLPGTSITVRFQAIGRDTHISANVGKIAA
ncbi:MAG: HAMP domain-containing protein [Pseudomonadota bacterium]